MRCGNEQQIDSGMGEFEMQIKMIGLTFDS